MEEINQRTLPNCDHEWIEARNSLALICVHCRYLKDPNTEKISEPRQNIGDITLFGEEQ